MKQLITMRQLFATSIKLTFLLLANLFLAFPAPAERAEPFRIFNTNGGCLYIENNELKHNMGSCAGMNLWVFEGRVTKGNITANVFIPFREIVHHEDYIQYKNGFAPIQFDYQLRNAATERCLGVKKDSKGSWNIVLRNCVGLDYDDAISLRWVVTPYQGLFKKREALIEGVFIQPFAVSAGANSIPPLKCLSVRGKPGIATCDLNDIFELGRVYD